MDNQTSVKLVFAIGLEGAIELATIVDQMIEQGEAPDNGETEELFGADRLIGSNFDLEGRFGAERDYLEPEAVAGRPPE